MISFFDKSICIGGYLHDFRIVDDANTIVERCSRCKKRVYMRRCAFTGDISKRLDQQLHLREMIQKWNPIYQKEYGNTK